MWTRADTDTALLLMLALAIVITQHIWLLQSIKSTCSSFVYRISRYVTTTVFLLVLQQPVLPSWSLLVAFPPSWYMIFICVVYVIFIAWCVIHLLGGDGLAVELVFLLALYLSWVFVGSIPLFYYIMRGGGES